LFEDQHFVTEALLEIDDNNNLTGASLALSWEFNTDATEVTFYLRPGVRWQSPRGWEHLDFGTITASDVAQTINANNWDVNPEADFFNPIAWIYDVAEAVDDLTLKIPIKRPIGFPHWFIGGNPWLGGSFPIYYTGSVASEGVDWAQEHPVGTGPFTQGECVVDEFCSFHSVNEHWRIVPDVDTFTFVLVEDPLTSYSLVKTGQLDATQLFSRRNLDSITGDNLRFVQTQKGFVSQSIMWSGNYWEETPPPNPQIELDTLAPWDGASYQQDYPWIGDPWQELHPEMVQYEDSNNPPGMTDMEQARLVRLALDIAIDRESIVDEFFSGLGNPQYIEYMGPNFDGWDPNRMSGVWSMPGQSLEPFGSALPVPWKLRDGDLEEADRLLTLAGFPLVNDQREGFGELKIVNTDAEFLAGDSRLLGPPVVEIWRKLGIDASILDVEYRSEVAPVLRSREQVWPVIKNGDVHDSTYPLDTPYPEEDTSWTRPNGPNFGYESPFLARQFNIVMESTDPEFRRFQHLTVTDYVTFWRMTGGLIQIPRGTLVSDRVESWYDPRSTQNPMWVYPRAEFLKLNRD
jgi:ABC-type transport system substrate-binding protein